MSRNQEIETAIENEADTDSGFAIAYSISKLAGAVAAVAYQLERIGLANAVVSTDAVEYLSEKMADARCESIYRAMRNPDGDC